MSNTKQVTLRLSDIETRENVRTEELKGLDELAQSISAVGILTPILVSPNGGDHMVLVAGHRRFAAIQLGIKDGILHPDFEIPAIVNEDAQNQAHRTVVQLVENLQRDDLPVIDEAKGFAELKAGGMAQKDIASQVGRSEAHVSKRLKLLGLPEDVQVIVNQGGVPLEVALELGGVDAEVARQITKQGMSATVRQVKAAKEQAKATATRTKIRSQLAEADITVFEATWKIEVPEGKIIYRGEPVNKVADLPNRIAGVLVNDYATDVEIVPVTFKAPSKGELEHQAEREREAKAADAARSKAQKRFLTSVDSFVNSPPAAAELIALLARVIKPGDATFVAEKDAELEKEGRTLAAWQLAGDPSALEARKLVASGIVKLLYGQSMQWSLSNEDEVMGLMLTGEAVGVDFPQGVQDNLLNALAGIWVRDEAQENADEGSPEEESPESE